jgi:hypothetical protein
MYFSDLTPYTYYHRAANGALNVGWLAKGHPFHQGEVSDQFLDALWRFCQEPVIIHRGFHTCEFCDMPAREVPTATHAGSTLRIGYQEIRAFGESDTVFAAPTLIFHYVTAHRYQPPAIFIDAVLTGPQPGTTAYTARLGRLTALDPG